MAKGKGQRPLPSTPAGRGPAPEQVQRAAPDHAAEVGRAPAPEARMVGSQGGGGRSRSGRVDYEPYVIAGTDCLAGHEAGQALEAGPIGTLPTRRTAWIGFGLLLWCGVGVAIVLERMGFAGWIPYTVVAALAWLLFSAFVQRRLGHRGKCWRTRAWRQAWGGLVPGRG